MANPAFGAISPRFAGTVRKDSQNVEQVNRNRGKNKFSLRQPVLSSARFGEVTPFFSERLLAGDQVTLNSKIDVWSSILQSPILQRLVMYKDYFYVPYKCLMPHSWDSFRNVPIQGDDVPEDVYLNYPLKTLVTFVLSYLNSNPSSELTKVTLDCQSFFQSLSAVRLLMSSGSLLSQFKINVGSMFRVNVDLKDPSSGLYPSFDSYVYDKLFTGTISTEYTDSPSDIYVTYSESSSPGAISHRVLVGSLSGNIIAGGKKSYIWNIPGVRVLLDVISANPHYVISPFDSSRNGDVLFVMATSLLSKYHTLLMEYFDITGDQSWINNRIVSLPSIDVQISNMPLVDLSEIYAYQSIGAQFYVNDDVDPVFTQKDFLETMQSFFSDHGVDPQTYDYNGSIRQYDVFSLRYTLALLRNSLKSVSNIATDFPLFDYICSLFRPFESLRFGDYLTGSRLSPLAVGASESASAPVVGDKVDAVDITKSIAWQSFLNDIMKLGPVSWIQQAGIYGETPSSLDPMPRFISRERQLIGQSDTTNTSTSQGEISSRFRGNDSQFAFKVDITEDCIVIGLLSFDMPRFYVNMTHRFAFTYDRYDFFQPYFQNIGDQAIYKDELNLSEDMTPSKLIDSFSWTLRDTQYKQRYPIAVGAFGSNDFLPSWAFLTDSRDQQSLTSDFIRNHNYEFDRFFKSLTHVSLGGYYHFYLRADNDCSAIRSMQYRPGIQLPMFHQ